ncbi:unnamed protein product [Phytomonas sp. EM1]|nr:unnamed protein product [Phytomonas sp. EM1]|eukprot:CCW60552.1 unnamed protein product [Phytomonas sp. isolate EM1]
MDCDEVALLAQWRNCCHKPIVYEEFENIDASNHLKLALGLVSYVIDSIFHIRQGEISTACDDTMHQSELKP